MRRRLSYQERVNVDVQKENLNAAFAELRKRGYIARQAFMCCGSCACCAIAEDASTLVKRGKTIRGAVYYHKQADEARDGGEDFYIGFGPVDVDGIGQVGLDAAFVASETVAVFQKHGLMVEWNGDPNRSICVKAAS